MNALSNQAHWDNLVSAFPQLRRQFVGFDRVFDLLNQNFEVSRENFPPFNIKKIDEEIGIIPGRKSKTKSKDCWL